MSFIDKDTAEMPALRAESEAFFSEVSKPILVTVGASTDRGRRREENQDHHAVMRRTRTQQILLSDGLLKPGLEAEEESYVLMVADGMGGAAFGEYASRLVIQTIWELTLRATSWVMRLKDLDHQQVRERVQAYVVELQRALRHESERDHKLTGMGTTLTAAYILGRDAVIAHIGDCRAYLFRGGSLMQITEDQTVAQRLIQMGSKPSEVSQFSHMLSNCLSTTEERVEAAIVHVPLKEGDRLLLCSDGLTKELADEELSGQLSEAISPQDVCDRLLRMAIDRGGRDNITVIVADLQG
jgi:serine/threonine protein phosphatase PrpC